MNKSTFIKNELYNLLKAIDKNITKCEYAITEYNVEYVIVWFENKYQRKICITADSIRAIAIDVIKNIN